jgi:hypothetical protein
MGIVSIVLISDSLLGGGRLENGGWDFGNFLKTSEIFPRFCPPQDAASEKKRRKGTRSLRYSKGKPVF